ncbi:MAG TPA: response regulator transcription factor [Acidimicrobiales bacterium]|nr:response regulator transcription factor [Acidimicrobiales bacterium]
MDEITVLIADSERLFAESLGRALAGEPELKVVGEHFGPGRAALDAVIVAQPNVVLYDFWTSGTSGPAAARYLSAWAPGSRVLLLSWLHGPYQVRESYDAGASGMVSKKISLPELVAAVRDVQAGRSVRCAEPVTRGVAKAYTGHDPAGCWARLEKLTPRELAVLQILSEVRPVTEVADVLGIARSTTKNHVHNILQKTDAASVDEVIDLAQHEGLLGR